MVFSKFEHDPVATAKQVDDLFEDPEIDKEPLTEIFEEPFVKSSDVADEIIEQIYPDEIEASQSLKEMETELQQEINEPSNSAPIFEQEIIKE
jgi:hypothetical protein